MTRFYNIGAIIVICLQAITIRAQVINDKSDVACAKNKAWLERCWSQGVRARLPNGTLYLKETAQTPTTISCGYVEAEIPSGYWIPADHPTLANWRDDKGRLHPIGSRICQLTPGIPAIRIRGASFRVAGFPMFEGQGTAAAIEMEGRAVGVATNDARIEANFRNWVQAVKCLGGYYQDGKFVHDEQQAADSTFTGRVERCDSIIRLDNQQAVNWRIDAFYMGAMPGGKSVLVDCQRGGSLTANITVASSPATILRLADYSDNNCNFDFQLWFDGMSGGQADFTLVDLAKPENWWAPWFIKMRGFSAQQRFGGTNSTKTCWHYNVPENMNRKFWNIDLDYIGK